MQRSVNKKSKAYKEGMAAAKTKKVSECPYFNDYGDNSIEIEEWVNGWGDGHDNKGEGSEKKLE